MRNQCQKLLRLLASTFLGLALVFLSLFAPLSNPVHALPETESSEEVLEEDTPTSPTDTDTDTGTDTETAAETPAEPVSGDNCTNQTGAVAWLVCPGTGLIANATDALYSIIENFLAIDPVSFNQESPVYNIWDYCRSITNIVFIIVILIIIFSQVTGLGFSNYNLKKTLPRIIVASILINLSFILCGFAVDISNVIGANLNSFFNSILENQIVSIGFDVDTYTLGNIATAVIAGGTIGGVAIGVVAAGGVAAFFWMLVPILLGALVSIVTGLLTISARQAVVVLLVMIAPLAIVAGALPNTEKWLEKWKSVFIQMLVFYPIFSFLFGASRLLGIIFIASATNVYGIILGIAVQVFPLFFSWQLMKMSNTLLGALSSKLNNLGQRGVAAARPWASSHQAVNKARHNATSSMPSARLTRYLEDRKARRESDLSRYQANAKLRSDAYAANVYNRQGRLTRRGESLYRLNADNLNNSATAKRLNAELDEAGYRTDGSDARIRAGRQQRRIEKTNQRLVQGVDLGHAADSFLESAKLSNANSYAGRVEKTREEVIRIRNDETLTEEQKAAKIAATDKVIATTLQSVTNPNDRTQYMNNVFAHAISAQTKADKMTRDNYSQLYAATQLTRNIHADFNKSFADRNYNSLEAAIDELAKRGDFDLIKESLEQHSGEIIDDVEMQKHLSDTLIKYKADSAPLWAYAKATNIRRAKHANAPDKVALFTTFEEFERGVAPHTLPTEDAEVTDSLSMIRLIKEINNPAIAVSQDRTTFKYLLQSQQDGLLDAKDLGFQIKQLRSAASSGQIDGEQLGNLNALLTGGLIFNSATGKLDHAKTKQKSIAYVQANKQQIRKNIINYVENMSAGQLAAMKESTFLALNGALAYIDGETTGDTSTGTPNGLSSAFRSAIYTNAASNMNNILVSNMNTNIKNWLGIANNRH